MSIWAGEFLFSPLVALQSHRIEVQLVSIECAAHIKPPGKLEAGNLATILIAGYIFLHIDARSGYSYRRAAAEFREFIVLI